MAYELIETIEVGAGGAASIEFTSIPQDGTDLLLKLSLRSNDAEELSYFRVNNDFGVGVYSAKELYGNGSTASSVTRTNLFYLYSPSNSYTSNTFGSINCYISNYANTTANKSISIENVAENNATLGDQVLIAASYNSTSAVSSVQIVHPSDVWVQYSTASLYKISNSDASAPPTPSGSPKATGGTTSYSSGYWYHTFTASGTFTPTEALTCDYLIVAGGGSGAGGSGEGQGAGGAGGYRAFTSQSVSATGYTITVGAGGSAPTSGNGSNGSDSSAFGNTSLGGGFGAFAYGPSSPSSPGVGGSGGGGSGFLNATGASGTSGQGNAGGNGHTSGTLAGGGGGGASAVGGNASFGQGGNGGNGTAWVNGTTYAGGGGGHSNSAGGTGGTGGGGAGAGGNVAGTSGTANTGGGGGGGGQAGGAGGSGIVIVRYAA